MEVLKFIIAVLCVLVASPLILTCALIGFLAFMAYTGFAFGWNSLRTP